MPIARLSPSALRKLLLGCTLLLLLTACEERSPESLSSPAVPTESPLPLPLTALPLPSPSWILEEDASLYRTLYHSTQNSASLTDFCVTDLGAEEEKSDRLITAVAADLVVQFYATGTTPLTEEGDHFVVFRSHDLLPIPSESLTLGIDPDGKPFLFSDVKAWVKDALTTAPDEV